MDENEDFTVESCRTAVERGDAGEWVEAFLGSDGSDNDELGSQLRRERTAWHGPVRIDFDRLHRLAGPDDQPVLDDLDEDDAETADDMSESVDDGWSPPPVIATWSTDHVMVEDGNHRIEGMRRAGRTQWWTLVGLDSESDRPLLLAHLAESSD